MVTGSWMLALGVALTIVPLCVALVLRVQKSAAAVSASIEAAADRDLADAFIFVDSRRLARASAIAALALATLVALLRAGPLLAIGLGAVVLAGPPLLLRRLKSRRQRRLVAQLPDAMLRLASLLQAGNSMSQALARMAETQAPPLRDEWMLMLRRIRMGERSDAVFEVLPARILAPEARLFATTVRVALDLGGGLAEALVKLADSTRRRLEMQERIRALTAQGRLQGLIVGLLPLVMIVVLAVMDTAAMSALWTRPWGWMALALLVVLEVCGFILIRRIVRIDV